MGPPWRRCAGVRRKPGNRDRSSAGAEPTSVAALGAIPVRGGATMAGAMHTEPVTYSADTTLRGFLATDPTRTGRRTGVLAVHEWWGLNGHLRRRASMLAELGYTALAVDMYGDGKVADNPADAGALMNAVLGNMQAGEARFRAAYD